MPYTKSHENQYRCIMCPAPAADHHEIYGGAHRQFCIANDLWVPICRGCHTWCERNKKKSPARLCGLLNLDYDKVNLAMHTRLHSQKSVEYLKKCGAKVKTLRGLLEC